MDNVTHALTGLLLADATTSWVSRRSTVPVSTRYVGAAAVLGVIAAEFPDSDLVYSGSVLGMGKLGYLMHHRGHTHTIVWAVVSALVLWYIACWLMRRRASDTEHVWLQEQGRWPLLVLAMMGTLSHIVLDWTNSYGVHPFWPFDNRWYYGDAVFIVEPWLWVIGIPAVLYSRHTRWAKGVLGVLLLLILAASWGLGQVARPVAVLVSVFAAGWLALQWRLTPAWRAASGIGAWVAATLVFFMASSRAKSLVRESASLSATLGAGAEAPRTTSAYAIRDIVLNPAPGDPTCWAALAITTDGQMYRLATAQVAPFGGDEALASCRTRYPQAHRVGGDALAALPDVSPVVPFGSTPHVHWRTSWAKPMADLIGLADERCEFAVSLRFMRAPAWRELANATVILSDVRFGVGGGFAEMEIPFSSTRDCSLRDAWVPGWTPPVL